MFGVLQNYFPTAVIMAVVLVVIFTELLKEVVAKIEIKLEKNGKQIKLFDHKKIWLAVFCSVVFSIALVLAGFFEWRKLFVYTPAILGIAIFLYEVILKPLKKLKNGEN
ncbi:MAG: hypothetical protein UIH18_05805 [Fibrobacteraceae bacterium]|jgi:4-hydroxybenzoate polyprenyltransferase|nr:hypothetical protein [Fibrobacteraceae bacterium]